MAGIKKSQKWITSNHEEKCRSIEEAVKKKEELICSNHLILGEESCVDSEGSYIRICAMKPGTWEGYAQKH